MTRAWSAQPATEPSSWWSLMGCEEVFVILRTAAYFQRSWDSHGTMHTFLDARISSRYPGSST